MVTCFTKAFCFERSEKKNKAKAKAHKSSAQARHTGVHLQAPWPVLSRTGLSKLVTHKLELDSGLEKVCIYCSHINT